MSPTGAAAPGRRERGYAGRFFGRYWPLGALAGFAAVVTPFFWPGQIDADTFDERANAASGHYTDWHTPILSALWRIPYKMGLRNFGDILFMGLFVLALGLYLVLRARLSRAAAVALTFVAIVIPPVLSWAIHVGRDEWFTAFSLCAFGMAIRVVRTEGRARIFSVAAALVFAFLAAAARQNALPTLLVLFVALALALVPRRLRYATVLAVVAGLLVTGVTYEAQSIIVYDALGSARLHPQETTFVFDLAALSRREHRVLIPASVYPAQNLRQIVRRSSDDSAADLMWGTHSIVAIPVNATRYPSLRHAWESALFDHPLAYLEERLDVAARLLSIDQRSNWVYQVPAGPPGYQPSLPALNRYAIDYLNLWTTDGNLWGGPIFDVWAYVLLLILLGAFFIRRSAKEKMLAALAAGYVIYFVVISFASPSVQYRFVYPVVVASCAVGLAMLPALLRAIASLAVRGVERRRLPAEPSPIAQGLATAPAHQPDEAAQGDGAGSPAVAGHSRRSTR